MHIQKVDSILKIMNIVILAISQFSTLTISYLRPYSYRLCKSKTSPMYATNEIHVSKLYLLYLQR